MQDSVDKRSVTVEIFQRHLSKILRESSYIICQMRNWNTINTLDIFRATDKLQIDLVCLSMSFEDSWTRRETTWWNIVATNAPTWIDIRGDSYAHLDLNEAIFLPERCPTIVYNKILLITRRASLALHTPTFYTVPPTKSPQNRSTSTYNLRDIFRNFLRDQLFCTDLTLRDVRSRERDIFQV